MSRIHLQLVGAVTWIAAAIAVLLGAMAGGNSDRQAGPIGLADFLFGSSQPILAVDPLGTLKTHDPVFLRDPAGRWHQVGHVTSPALQPGARIELVWYSNEFDPSPYQLLQHHHDGSLAAMVALMLPIEKRQRIQQLLQEAFRTHGDELTAAILPLMEQSLRESLPVIEAELSAALQRHADDVDALLQHWNQTLVDRHLVPLARDELLPIVRRHGDPVAAQIGRELWNRVSLWSFGWRALYDRAPLPRQNLVEQEWLRFVEAEVVPVVDQHMEEIVVALQRMMRDVASDPKIRDRLAVAAGELVDDPQSRQVATKVLQESVVENRALRDRWRQIWSSDEARQALTLAGERLQPVVRQIGDTLFGTRQRGIDPGFARLLRSQVLGKDRRWIVALPADGGTAETPPVIRPAAEPIPFPIVHLAGDV